MVILMPCAGLYRRFPQDEMPKYIRPLNDIRPMISWALDGLRELTDKRICFAVRKADEDKWGVSEIIKGYEFAQVMVLDNPTNGPAHTIYEMLKYFNIEETFLVHDCDCSWSPKSPVSDKENFIAVAWRETAIGDRGSKSWIYTHSGIVTGVEEKKTITDWYCCGGFVYGCKFKCKCR